MSRSPVPFLVQGENLPTGRQAIFLSSAETVAHPAQAGLRSVLQRRRGHVAELVYLPAGRQARIIQK